ncbi:MAG: HRDC domain-containing protein [Deltaproteobacteria bacterium]|jgi:ribonuclease D|nr:HRDC domain-containing protein [Deltaproteobacteria bacterium]
MNTFDWIDTERDFEQLVDELCETRAYALDTEFHRERSYLPVLAVIQIATPERTALVDPLAVDVRPLRRVLERDIVCVMHAASQDLEILELACGVAPRRLFDTQIAALFCGYRTSSLGKLVEGFLGLQLEKSAQLADWTRRPLPDADLAYAASDVAHLLELRDALSEKLRARGRLSWAEEEIERLRRKDRSPPEPRTLWWKLRGKAKLNGKARGVAQELAAWREEEARGRNKPVRSILPDMTLLSLAQRPARKPAELRNIRNFDARRFKQSDALLAAIERGLRLPRSELKLPPKKPTNIPNAEGVISLCLAWLAQRASQEDLDMTVLGTRDDVTSLVHGQRSRLSDGWRHQLVGTELSAIIGGTAALRVDGTALELVDRNRT